MPRKITLMSTPRGRALAHPASANPTPVRETPPPRTVNRNVDGNARLTGISASFVLPLILFEVATVVLGVKSVITPHVVVGLLLVGPVSLKLGSVTYRMVSYYRGVSEYRRRGKPATGLRLLGSSLAVLLLLLLASGLVLIVGPSWAHSTARTVHVVTAYGTVALLIVHLSVHLVQALRLASADVRPRTRTVPGARSRLLALSASLALGGVLAVLLGGRGSTYLHHYYPGYSPQRTPLSTHNAAADRGGRPSRVALVGVSEQPREINKRPLHSPQPVERHTYPPKVRS